MVKRLIGSDTTGTDGSVSIPYEGTGAGLVNLSVETEIDGSIVSGTLPVLDCSFYDKGTSDSPSPKVVNFRNALKITRGSEGTLVERETTGNAYYLLNQTNADEYPYDVNFCIEFDITQVTGEVGLSYANGNWRGTMISTYGTGHYKIECTDTYQKIITPIGQVQYDHTYSANTSLRLQFYNVSSVEYNNFKIYPI